eukprot:6987155-Prymnesium_polylepis.2
MLIDVQPQSASSTDCNSVQRSLHSRPLRPGTWVDTSDHGIGLASRPPTESSERSARSRASPPVAPVHAIGSAWDEGKAQGGASSRIAAAACNSWSRLYTGSSGPGGGGCTRERRQQVSGGSSPFQ